MNQRDEMARLMLLVENAGKPMLEADYPIPYDSTKPGKEEPGKEVAQTTQPKTMKRRDFLRKAGQLAGSVATEFPSVAQLAYQALPTPAPAPSAPSQSLAYFAHPLQQAYTDVYEYTKWYDAEYFSQLMNYEAPEFSAAMAKVNWDFKELVRKVSPEKVKQFLNDLKEVEYELDMNVDRLSVQSDDPPVLPFDGQYPVPSEEDFNENLNHIKKLAGLKQ